MPYKNSHPILTEDFFRTNYVGDTTINDLCKISGYRHDTVKKWLLRCGLSYTKPKYRVKPQIIDKQVIVDLYTNQQLTVHEIADRLQVTVAVVKRSFDEHQIKYERFSGAQKVGLTREQLIQWHNIDRIPLNQIAKMLDKSDVWVGNQCRLWGIGVHNFAPRSTSVAEQNLLEFIRQYFPSASKRKYGRKELDIVIPERSLAIEYCGIYWHSDAVQTDSKHHLNKMLLANQHQLQLLTIYEDEYRDKQQIVQSAILAKLGKLDKKVFARNTTVVQLTSRQANQFYDSNHIQGATARQKVNVGLVNNDQIVAAMSIGLHPRNNCLTLSRYATLLNTNVVGGASRLLSHATNTLQIDRLISWSDNRWSNGNLYQQLGFTLDGQLAPTYDYVKNGVRLPMQRFTKAAIGCPDNITESAWMSDQGYHRIWNCGKIRWTWRK